MPKLRIFFSLCLILSMSTLLARETKERQVSINIDLSTKGNNIEFDQKAIQVPYGKEIKLDFKNRAFADSQIDHNVVIIKPNSEKVFLEDLRNASYDLEKMKTHKAVVAISEQIAPGETTSLVFKPEVKGFFPFLCIMPGHGDVLDMKGIMHVR